MSLITDGHFQPDCFAACIALTFEEEILAKYAWVHSIEDIFRLPEALEESSTSMAKPTPVEQLMSHYLDVQEATEEPEDSSKNLEEQEKGTDAGPTIRMTLWAGILLASMLLVQILP